MNEEYTVYTDYSQGFNRYMVECESEVIPDATTETTSFNRYMVECEWVCGGSGFYVKFVLIDTWWNVN